MSAFPTGNPGIRTERSVSFARVLLAAASGMFLPTAKIINGALSRDTGNTGDLDVLRPGLLMGRITASGKYAPSILGITQASRTTANSDVTVTTAEATEIVRRYGATPTLTLVGGTTAGGTPNVWTEVVSSIVTGTGVITFSNVLNNNLIAGAFVMASDGSENPRCLIGNEDGVKVTDEDALSVDIPFASMLVGGILDSSGIPFWPSDTGLQAWLVSQLNTYGRFIFDHQF